ncbi:unnamed protein product, partial [Tetraodon nigroviridis]
QVELCEALRHSVAALQQEREALREEQRHHRALGASIDSLVQERLKANERDKYSVFVGEPADCCCRGASGGCVCASDALVSAGDLERIVNLLLSLCSRLMRIDRALLALERDPLLQEDAAEERDSLLHKRSLVLRQTDDAQELKENLERRQRVVHGILSGYLTPAQLRDYRGFVSAKPSLLIRQRHLDNLIRHREEHLSRLADSLPRELADGAPGDPPVEVWRFVNSLATVQQVEGVSYVVLRKKFRGKTPGGVERSSGEAPGGRSEASPGTDAQSPAGGAGGQPFGGVGKVPPPPSTASPAPSSPSSSSSERKLPEIYVRDVRGDLLPPADLHWSSGSGVGAGPGPGQGCAPDRPEAEQRPLQPPASAPSRSSIFPERTGSLEELRSGAAAPVRDPGIPEQLPRSKLCETRRSSDHLHVDQEPSVWSWRPSAGHLLSDRPDSESGDGSVFSPHLRKRPAELGGVGGGLRSRMCLSLGADLDQLLQEEAGRRGAGGTEAARLNRLTLISSSLSLHRRLSTSSLSSCSTPPRCHSLSNLLEGAGRSRSPAAGAKAHDEDHARQSLVPLEAREHAWLVKGAAGAWPDIYSLFREDSSLLNRKDFISGFTVLHWIAKHGTTGSSTRCGKKALLEALGHIGRVSASDWYGVEKAGLTFDVNARSTSGHTPLHIAAIHGHKNIIRLLVRKFNADVRLRDTAGKKAWHYLGGATPLDVFQLLGAPPAGGPERPGRPRENRGGTPPPPPAPLLRPRPATARSAKPRSKGQARWRPFSSTSP